MAFRAVFVLLFVLATFGPIITSAKDFIVGDQSGWTVGFDYQAWAAGKEFHIGDKLGKSLRSLNRFIDVKVTHFWHRNLYSGGFF